MCDDEDIGDDEDDELRAYAREIRRIYPKCRPDRPEPGPSPHFASNFPRTPYPKGFRVQNLGSALDASDISPVDVKKPLSASKQGAFLCFSL